jgi:hypothetical protein
MSVLVTLEPTAVEVDPGATQDVVVRVRNTGQIVDRFVLDVLGEAAAWASVTPASLSLFPGTEETVRIAFAPPTGCSPRAGLIVFAVRVQSSEDPADSVVEEGTVTVGPSTATTAELVPQTSRGSRSARHELSVANRGNVPVEVSVQPSDPDRLVNFDVRPPVLELEPCESGSARIRVRPNETILFGAPQSHPFVVTVVSSGQASIELRGTMLQRALLPSWIPRAAALLAAVLVVGVGAVLAGVIPPKPASTPTPLIAAATATPTPVATPTALPTDAAPTEAPTPTSTPVPDITMSIPDPNVLPLAGALQQKCGPANGQCWIDAADTATQFINTLSATYVGPGIVNPQNPYPSFTITLPVELSSTTPFTWQSATGTSGPSSLVVVDLAPLLADQASYAYAVVMPQDNVIPLRFVVPLELAKQLYNILYQPKEPEVVPTPPPSWMLPDTPDLQVSPVYTYKLSTYSFTWLSQLTPTP